MYHIFLIYSSVNGHLGSFLVWALVSNAAMNTVYKHLFEILLSFLLGPRNGIDKWHDNSVFNFLRKCHIIFHSGTTILYSHQQCTRVPIIPHPHQHLLFSGVFFIVVILQIEVILRCRDSFKRKHRKRQWKKSVHMDSIDEKM